MPTRLAPLDVELAAASKSNDDEDPFDPRLDECVDDARDERPSPDLFEQLVPVRAHPPGSSGREHQRDVICCGARHASPPPPYV